MRRRVWMSFLDGSGYGLSLGSEPYCPLLPCPSRHPHPYPPCHPVLRPPRGSPVTIVVHAQPCIIQ